MNGELTMALQIAGIWLVGVILGLIISIVAIKRDEQTRDEARSDTFELYILLSLVWPMTLFFGSFVGFLVLMAKGVSLLSNAIFRRI